MSWCLCQGLEQCLVCIKSTQDSVVITTISISLVYYKFCQVNNCIVNTMSPRSRTGAGTHTHTQIKLKNTTSVLRVINWDIQIYDSSEFKNNYWKNHIQANSEITNKKELMKTGEEAKKWGRIKKDKNACAM